MNPTIPIVLLLCGIVLLIGGGVFYIVTQDKIDYYVRRQSLSSCPVGVESNWNYFGDHQEVNVDNIPFADITGNYHMVYIWNITNPTETLNGGKPSLHLMGPYSFDRFGGTIRTYFRNYGQEYGSSAYTHTSRFLPERSARDATKDYVTALDYEYNRQVHMLTERGTVNGPAGEWFTGDFLYFHAETDWYIQSYAWHLPEVIKKTIDDLTAAIMLTNGNDEAAAITTIVDGWANGLDNTTGVPDYFRISTGTASGISDSSARTLLLGSSGVGFQNPAGSVYYFCPLDDPTDDVDDYCWADIAAGAAITEAQALQVWQWMLNVYYEQVLVPAILAEFGPEGLTDVLDIPYFHFVSTSYGGGKSVADYDTVTWPYGAPEFGHVLALDPAPAGVTFGLDEAYVMLSWTAYNLAGWENMAFATGDFLTLGLTPGNPDEGFVVFTEEQTLYFLDHYINGQFGVWNKGISYLFGYNDGSAKMDPAMVNLGDPIIQTILVFDWCTLWHSPWYDRVFEFHPTPKSAGVIGWWNEATLAKKELDGLELFYVHTGRYDDTQCNFPVLDTSENSYDYVWGDKLPEGYISAWLGMNQINDHQDIGIYNDIWGRAMPFVYEKDVKHWGRRTFARYQMGWNTGNLAKGVEPYTNVYDGVYDVAGAGLRLPSRGYTTPAYFVGSDPTVTTDLLTLSPPAPTHSEFDWYIDYDEHSGLAVKEHICYQQNHRIEDEYYNFYERNITKQAFIPMMFKRIVYDWTDPATAYWINAELNEKMYDPQANAFNAVIVTSVFGSIMTIAGIVCAVLMCIKR